MTVPASPAAPAAPPAAPTPGAAQSPAAPSGQAPSGNAGASGRTTAAPPPGPPLIIAIDGPAAAGKGTLARRLAAALDLPYLDTGLLYRATARRLLDAGQSLTTPEAAIAQAQSLHPEDLASPNLRTPEIDRTAAGVASIPGVRAALLAFQRNFAQSRGAVLDGRDIGTVIFPDATVKLFVNASVEARAHRRWLELKSRNIDADLQTVTDDMAARDAADAARAAAPLRPADDAILLDTTTLGPDEAFNTALSIIQAKQTAAAV
jgi:cytidylate kinase